MAEGNCVSIFRGSRKIGQEGFQWEHFERGANDEPRLEMKQAVQSLVQGQNFLFHEIFCATKTLMNFSKSDNVSSTVNLKEHGTLPRTVLL